MLTVASSLPLSDAFGPFGDTVWLNSAHQGPLPALAQQEIRTALEEKINPSRMNPDSFRDDPSQLRATITRLLNADRDDVLIANSTTHTLNLVAQGLTWREGDEVLCIDGDFPASVLPWKSLEAKGVKVRLVEAELGRVEPEMIERALTGNTRVVCISWVFSFYGNAVDVEAIGSLCRERGVWFVVNGSQAVGARQIDVEKLPIDALACCGWKWLCGPYSTGFGWLRKELREAIDYPLPHWQRFRGTTPAATYHLPEESTAAQFDVYCGTNFFGSRPLRVSVEHLLDIGIDRIAAHDQALVEQLLTGLDGTPFRLLSPRGQAPRSTIVVLSHDESARNESVWRRLRQQGICTAYYQGSIRISPHLFNSGDDVVRLVDGLRNVV